MGVNDHDFAFLEGVAIQEVGDVAGNALQPQQAGSIVGADDVMPHQAGIHQRMPTHVAAVAGEYVLNGQNGVAAAEHVNQLAGSDGFSAQLSSCLDCRSNFGAVNLLDDLVNAVDILKLRHSNWNPPIKCSIKN